MSHGWGCRYRCAGSRCDGLRYEWRWCRVATAPSPQQPEERAEREPAEVGGPGDTGVASDVEDLGEEEHEHEPDRLHLSEQHRPEEDDRFHAGRRVADRV